MSISGRDNFQEKVYKPFIIFATSKNNFCNFVDVSTFAFFKFFSFFKNFSREFFQAFEMALLSFPDILKRFQKFHKTIEQRKQNFPFLGRRSPLDSTSAISLEPDEIIILHHQGWQSSSKQLINTMTVYFSEI